MNLRVARELKKLSQAKLAKLSGTTQVTISLIETGKASPYATTRCKLEKVLGRRINWLHTKGQRTFRQQGKGTAWECVEQEFRKALYSINLLNKNERQEFLKLAKTYIKELAVQ